MATPPSLKLEVLSTTATEAIIRVNQQNYKFTILRDVGTGWNDITTTKDWKNVVTHITELFLEVTAKTEIQQGEIVLSSPDFSTLDTPTPSVHSSHMKVISAKTDGLEINPAHLTPQQRNIAQTKLQQIAQDFSTIKPLSTASAHAPAAPAPKIRIPDAVTTIDIDNSGQCADSSLAYLMLMKTGTFTDLLGANRGFVDHLSGRLRVLVADKIRKDPTLDHNPFFFWDLVDSIQNIPPSERRRVHTILSTASYETNAAHKKALREFYADYITKGQDAGKMSNQLDSAFFHILPTIQFGTSLDTTFPHGVKFAIVQGNQITRKYPLNEELNENDWLFINYNGVDHYTAVDMNDTAGAKSKVTSMIFRLKLAMLSEFLLGLNSFSAQEIQDRLNDEIKVQWPAAFNVIAGQVYAHDKALWDANPQGANPASDPSYGENKIRDADPDELQAILTAPAQLNEIISQINTLT